jgi:hypothetical protein
MRKTFGLERRSFLHHFESEGVRMSGWHFTATESHSIFPQDPSALQGIAQNKRMFFLPSEPGMEPFHHGPGTPAAMPFLKTMASSAEQFDS